MSLHVMKYHDSLSRAIFLAVGAHILRALANRRRILPRGKLKHDLEFAWHQSPSNPAPFCARLYLVPCKLRLGVLPTQACHR